MKKVFLTISVLIFLFKSNFAQSDNNIIGKWFVEKTIVNKNSIPKGKENTFNKMILKLNTCFFEFKANGELISNFSFDDMKITNAFWTYDIKEKIIKITEFNNDESTLILILFDNKSNENIYFNLLETPIKIKMKKQ